MPRRSASIARRHPNRVDVPLLLIASALLLAGGVLLPAVEARTLLFWRNEYSILLNIRELNRDGKDIGAIILLVCSVIYPATKLVVLCLFWLMPFPARWRARLIMLLRILSRWSMVDVLAVVAIVLAGLSLGPLEANPKIGLYLYASGILCLMCVSFLMDRLAQRAA